MLTKISKEELSEYNTPYIHQDVVEKFIKPLNELGYFSKTQGRNGITKFDFVARGVKVAVHYNYYDKTGNPIALRLTCGDIYLREEHPDFYSAFLFLDKEIVKMGLESLFV